MCLSCGQIWDDFALRFWVIICSLFNKITFWKEWHIKFYIWLWASRTWTALLTLHHSISKHSDVKLQSHYFFFILLPAAYKICLYLLFVSVDKILAASVSSNWNEQNTQFYFQFSLKTLSRSDIYFWKKFKAILSCNNTTKSCTQHFWLVWPTTCNLNRKVQE